MPADAGDDCTDCTVGTVDNNDDMSEIVQLDGCDSVSTSSTDSHSDTLSIADSSSPSFGEYNYDDGGTDYSEYHDSSEEEPDAQSEAIIGVVAGPMRSQDDAAAPVWFEEYVPRPASLPCTRQTIRRDNRFEKCGMLPTVLVPNARSIFPKLNRFLEDMKMRSISFSLISETWQKE